MSSLKVRIEGVHRRRKGFVVVLRSEGNRRVLPIFVSGNQAQSIQMGLSGKEPPRPLTHDILLQIIGDQDLSVESVTVDDLYEGTFTAELILGKGDTTFSYDVRPSDAIALAVRKGADICVSENVMERAGKEMKREGDESRKLALKRFRDKSRE
ncbi:hypothetical protein AKJ64_04570 [candidate division MSBL1 archaeon SCGC-AAA259E17]|uniref:BFN domain-containing protein n=1 Tax=candidate division MSBL1 archaeon SCGC-AAA259E17 TaxID=1698263 RepID=A0A133UBZ6_9EURY|nr:hypothetical protein AKJ64_04570 [candidate division MSBL1 archaeon SCGC-AAA259E17]